MGPTCSHKCQYRGEAGGHATTDRMKETGVRKRCFAAGFEDGGRGHEPRNGRGAALATVKRQRDHCMPTVSGGSAALLTPGFGPLTAHFKDSPCGTMAKPALPM